MTTSKDWDTKRSSDLVIEAEKWLAIRFVGYEYGLVRKLVEALVQLAEHHKNLKANEARAREHYLARLEAAEAALACVKAQPKLVQQACEAAADNLARATAAEAALSAHREALEQLISEWRAEARDIANTSRAYGHANSLSECANRLAALASPKEEEKHGRK